jgi:hypothetical protein
MKKVLCSLLILSLIYPCYFLDCTETVSADSSDYYHVNVVSNNEDYGTVTGFARYSVPVGFVPYVEEDILHIKYCYTTNTGVFLDERSITPYPHQSDEQYTYSFEGWDIPECDGKSDIMITANFSRILKQYTISFTNDIGMGEWTYNQLTVDYGSIITTKDNTITVNDITNTFTCTPSTNTEYNRLINFSGMPVNGIVTENLIVKAETTRDIVPPSTDVSSLVDLGIVITILLIITIFLLMGSRL